MSYPQLGHLSIVPQADLEDLQSAANRAGDGRVGSNSNGKRPAQMLVMDASGTYSLVFALGLKSSDGWNVCDGSATLIPTNVLDAGGGAEWTLTTATYSAGVLTASGADAQNATQDVDLSAGTYRVVGQVNRHTSDKAAKLKITSDGADGVVLTKVFSNATVSSGDTVKDDLAETFTLTEAATVTIDLNIVAVSGGANSTGAAYISFIFEAA